MGLAFQKIDLYQDTKKGIRKGSLAQKSSAYSTWG